MKNTIKIVEIYGGKTIEQNGFNVQLVNISTFEPLLQFKVNEDGEKELKNVHQLTLRLSEFKKLFVLDDMLALINPKKLTDEEKNLTDEEKFSIIYRDQIRVLKGAKLVIERDEILENNDDEDNDEEENDQENDQEKKLISFGEMKFLSLTLTPAARQKAEKIVFEE